MTIIGAVLISGFVSLTLTPMMCSRILKPHRADERHGRVYMAFERGLRRLARLLRQSRCAGCSRTSAPPWSAFLAICVATGRAVRTRAQGLPAERGLRPAVLLHRGAAGRLVRRPWSTCSARSPTSSRKDPNVEACDVLHRRDRQLTARSTSAASPSRSSPSTSASRPTRWCAGLRPKLANVLGVKVFSQNVPAIRIGGSSPRAPTSTSCAAPTTEELYQWAPRIEQKLRTLPGLIDVTSDLQITRPAGHRRDRPREGVGARRVGAGRSR